MLQQERDKQRQERIIVENDLLQLINRDQYYKREQEDLRALSRNIVNKTSPAPQKLYTYVGGTFWKTPTKNYYKTVQKGLGDITIKRKRIRKEMDGLLVELIKRLGKDDYSLLNTVVAEELQEYQQRIEDEVDLAD